MFKEYINIVKNGNIMTKNNKSRVKKFSRDDGQQLLGDSKYVASLLELPSPSTSSNLSPSFPNLDVSMDGSLW